MFPAEPGVPGARDVKATAYLQWVLSDPGLEHSLRRVFASGVEQLEQLSLDSSGHGYHRLSPEQREDVLRRMEGQGDSWIRELLNYLFEALLTDPVYGANPGGIGWQWLGHTPGFKRPPANKRYFLL